MPFAPANSPGRPRVLLVEDDDAVRRSLQLLLSAHGYEVRAYPNGAGLPRDTEALRTDAMIADLVIPDGNAVTLLTELREAGWAGPAILISGHLTNEWAERALAHGYSAAFAKPIGDAVLVKCLARLLPSAEAERSAD